MDDKINNNNTLSVYEKAISDSPKRKKLKDIKNSGSNNSGYFNFDTILTDKS